MPGGGGGRKDMVVVQDVSDEQFNAKTRRVSPRRLPQRLKRRLNLEG